jgi:2-polyprenyl-3-methyl-5-hydroxy-6-metoxy-1,4-benzoquinol methylase
LLFFCRGAAFRQRHRFAERIEIAEVGCGYGRDAFAFAQAGFDVVGSEIARQALILAHQDYKRMSRLAVPGSVQFLHGTIRTVAAAAVETFDAIASHRTLHLMAKEEILSFREIGGGTCTARWFHFDWCQITNGLRSEDDGVG